MWPNSQETADLVTFTEEILNGKLYFSCSESVEIANLIFFSEWVVFSIISSISNTSHTSKKEHFAKIVNGGKPF